MEELAEGAEVVRECDGDQFAYYRFTVTTPGKVLVITYFPHRAEPANENSDPDLYISNVSPHVTQDNYVWKSANIGADRVEIHPSDEHFTLGTYYVGVFAFKPGLNTFRIRYSQTPAEPVSDLPESHETSIDTWEYFKFPVCWPGESRIEVVVAPSSGSVAVFVSSSVYYPNEREHQYSAGYFDEAVLKQIGQSSYQEYDEEYKELDAFDAILQRNFTRRPTDREIDSHERVRTHKQSFAESKDMTFATNGQEVRLCVETDDWKYSTMKCYVGVKNLGTERITCRIRRREVREEDLLPDEQQAKSRYFHSLFSEVDGSSVSQSERKRLQVLCQSEFTYGEVEFEHLIALLDLCQPTPGSVFWDLGSGSGKCLVAAALLYPHFSSVNGVEYLPKLYELSTTVVSQLQSTCPTPLPAIHIVHGDMLETDWSDADLIFTSSICFPMELIQGMLQLAKKLKKGTKFITLRSFPPNDVFEVRHSLKVKMTWGKTVLYILEKVA